MYSSRVRVYELVLTPRSIRHFAKSFLPPSYSMLKFTDTWLASIHDFPGFATFANIDTVTKLAVWCQSIRQDDFFSAFWQPQISELIRKWQQFWNHYHYECVNWNHQLCVKNKHYHTIVQFMEFIEMLTQLSILKITNLSAILF